MTVLLNRPKLLTRMQARGSSQTSHTTTRDNKTNPVLVQTLDSIMNDSTSRTEVVNHFLASHQPEMARKVRMYCALKQYDNVESSQEKRVLGKNFIKCFSANLPKDIPVSLLRVEKLRSLESHIQEELINEPELRRRLASRQ